MKSLLKSSWSWLTLVAIGALVLTGVAIAKHASPSTQSVAATFTATTVADRTTHTCTGSDGAYEVTHAKYTGAAVSSDSRLNGAIELRVKSVYNTTENLGWIEAKVQVRSATGASQAHGKLRAVNVAGQAEGLLAGSVRDDHGKLLANVSATYSSAGGFTAGQLGAGTSANTAIVYAGGCGKDKAAKAHRTDKSPKEHKAPKAHKSTKH